MTGKAQGRKRKLEELQESGGRPRKKGKIIIFESESDSDETPNIKRGSKRSSGVAAAVDDDNGRNDSGDNEDSEKGEGDTGHATEDEHEESSEESQDTDDKPLRELHRLERRKSLRRARDKKDSDKESESQRESEGDDSAESTHTQDDDAEDSEESQSATPEDDSLSDEEGHPKSRKKCDNCARKNKTCMKRSGFDSCAPCHFAGIECRFPVSRHTFIMDEADDYGTNLKYAG